jgi:hypothetical protein
MGWWGTQIMSGDEPYDWMGTFMEQFNVPEKYFHEGARGDASAHSILALQRVRAKITQEILWTKLIPWIESGGTPIAWQVLGVFLMRFGVHMNDALIGRIIDACLEDEYDAYRDPEERIASLLSFINDLLEYQAPTPKDLTEEQHGLMDTILEHMINGKEGLVNQ